MHQSIVSEVTIHAHKPEVIAMAEHTPIEYTFTNTLPGQAISPDLFAVSALVYGADRRTRLEPKGVLVTLTSRAIKRTVTAEGKTIPLIALDRGKSATLRIKVQTPAQHQPGRHWIRLVIAYFASEDKIYWNKAKEDWVAVDINFPAHVQQALTTIRQIDTHTAKALDAEIHFLDQDAEKLQKAADQLEQVERQLREALRKGGSFRKREQLDGLKESLATATSDMQELVSLLNQTDRKAIELKRDSENEQTRATQVLEGLPDSEQKRALQSIIDNRMQGVIELEQNARYMQLAHKRLQSTLARMQKELSPEQTDAQVWKQRIQVLCEHLKALRERAVKVRHYVADLRRFQQEFSLADQLDTLLRARAA